MSKLGELKEILKKLIAIPSVTGNEHDIAIYIADYLRQCGVDSVELQEYASYPGGGRVGSCPHH